MNAAAKRVAISLAPSERDALRQLAHQAGEPLATTAGRLVRAALTDQGAQLDTMPAGRAGPPGAHTRKRTPPPESAGAIARLRARYPVELRHLPADPSADTYIAEQTAALIAWRANLDAAGTDANPREILAFGHELRTFATVLQDRARRGR